MLGEALQGLPRDQLVVSSKVGRYGADTFDFSADRVKASVRESLGRLKLDYLDVCICHDVEFGDLRQVRRWFGCSSAAPVRHPSAKYHTRPTCDAGGERDVACRGRAARARVGQGGGVLLPAAQGRQVRAGQSPARCAPCALTPPGCW